MTIHTIASINLDNPPAAPESGAVLFVSVAGVILAAGGGDSGHAGSGGSDSGARARILAFHLRLLRIQFNSGSGGEAGRII